MVCRWVQLHTWRPSLGLRHITAPLHRPKPLSLSFNGILTLFFGSIKFVGRSKVAHFLYVDGKSIREEAEEQGGKYLIHATSCSYFKTCSPKSKIDLKRN